MYILCFIWWGCCADFEDIYLVSDLMDTDLHRVIYSRQPLTHEHHQYFVYQILLAVAFLHEGQIENLFLKDALSFFEARRRGGSAGLCGSEDRRCFMLFVLAFAFQLM